MCEENLQSGFLLEDEITFIKKKKKLTRFLLFCFLILLFELSRTPDDQRSLVLASRVWFVFCLAALELELLVRRVSTCVHHLSAAPTEGFGEEAAQTPSIGEQLQPDACREKKVSWTGEVGG